MAAGRLACSSVAVVRVELPDSGEAGAVTAGCAVDADALRGDGGVGVSGNNSVVECDLAKVEVAGSNPVSRSIFPTFRTLNGAVAKW